MNNARIILTDISLNLCLRFFAAINPRYRTTGVLPHSEQYHMQWHGRTDITPLIPNGRDGNSSFALRETLLLLI
jgi:hypothetical protein